jgi:hypothetical protein
MVKVKHNEWLQGYNMFVLAYQVEQVYYLPYISEKLSAWWVVHKVNPHEWLYTPTLDDKADEVYQEEEFPASFVVEPSVIFDDLVGDANNIL